MGWNSWDCFGAAVTEAQVRANAEYMAENMKAFGWEYVVVDIEWYQPTADSHEYKPFSELVMDGYGRLFPAPERFPSAKDGRGFTSLAEYVHSLGLKFGIHIMRGMPRMAAHRNLPILDSEQQDTAGEENSESAEETNGEPTAEFTAAKRRNPTAKFTAAEVADPNSVCAWNPDMYGLKCETNEAGAYAYYLSIFRLYASWGVDFVKTDDIAREYPHCRREIELISKACRNCGRDIVLSLSPGPAPLEMAEHLKENADMWRITDDFWDEWRLLLAMFERAEKWCTHSGPGHWPDADMLPVGALKQDYGKENRTKFTADEQRTMMSLWCMMRSPLMVGADLPKNDRFTLELLTNRDILEIEEKTWCAHQLYRTEEEIAWLAPCRREDACYAALFNISGEDRTVRFRPEEHEIYLSCLAENEKIPGPKTGGAKSDKVLNLKTETENGIRGYRYIRELWTGKDIAPGEELKIKIPSHGAAVLRFSESSSFT